MCLHKGPDPWAFGLLREEVVVFSHLKGKSLCGY